MPPWLNPEFKAQEKKREKAQQAQKLDAKKQEELKHAVKKQEQAQQQRKRQQKQNKQDSVQKSDLNLVIQPQSRSGKLASTPSNSANRKQLIVK